MSEEKKFELIVTIVNRGHSDKVVEGARLAGAHGGTILYGRGTSKNERDSILGISIQPEKELVLTLTTAEKKKTIMEGICEHSSLDEPGKGMCFSLPVNQVRGITEYKKEKNDDNKVN